MNCYVNGIEQLLPGFTLELPNAMPPNVSASLPSRIIVASGPGKRITSAVNSTLARMDQFLRKEAERRDGMIKMLEMAKLLPKGWFAEHVRKTRELQPWILVLREGGGLPHSDAIVPCSTLRHHAVGYADGLSFLLTGQEPGSATWSEDSDFGHESAHATFAPLPPFYDGRGTLGELTGALFWARFAYLCCELAVCGLRLEVRHKTETGGPVQTSWEMDHFIKIAHLRVGSKFALRDPASLTAFCLQQMPAISSLANRPDLPEEAEWRQLLGVAA